MRLSGENSIVRETQAAACRELSIAALLNGGISLILLYAGSMPMKLCTLTSAVVAVLLVWWRPVFPFGYLLTNRTQAYLEDARLGRLVSALESQKKRQLPVVLLAWLVVQTTVVAVGSFSPPSIAKPFEEIPLLFILVMTGISLTGATAIFWLSLHLAVLRQDKSDPKRC